MTNHVVCVTARVNQLTGAGSVSLARLLLVGWSFPFGGISEYLTPRCPPIRISDSAFNTARRDGNFEVFHVVMCRISHFRDVAHCWIYF
jgi:hypothetical protein